MVEKFVHAHLSLLEKEREAELEENRWKQQTSLVKDFPNNMATPSNIIVIEPLEKEYTPGFVPGMNVHIDPIVIEPETDEDELEPVVSNSPNVLQVKFPLKRKLPASGKQNPKAHPLKQKPSQPTEDNSSNQLTVKFPKKKKERNKGINVTQQSVGQEICPRYTESGSSTSFPSQILNSNDQVSLIDRTENRNHTETSSSNLLTVKFPLRKKLSAFKKIAPYPKDINVSQQAGRQEICKSNTENNSSTSFPSQILNSNTKSSLIDPPMLQNKQSKNSENVDANKNGNQNKSVQEKVTEKTDANKNKPPSKKLVNSKEIKALNANIRKSNREKKATKFSDCVRLDSESEVSSSEEDDDDEDEDSEETDEMDSVCTVCHSYEPPIEFEKGSDVASFELKWIDCDHCHQWFHWFCVGIFDDKEDTNFFKCKICKTKSYSM